MSTPNRCESRPLLYNASSLILLWNLKWHNLCVTVNWIKYSVIFVTMHFNILCSTHPVSNKICRTFRINYILCVLVHDHISSFVSIHFNTQIKKAFQLFLKFSIPYKKKSIHFLQYEHVNWSNFNDILIFKQDKYM